jgi:hypothetical protein
VVADLLEVAVEGGTFLLPVDGVFCGIYIDNESSFVSAPKQGVGASVERIFEGLQPLTGCKHVVLKTAECGLACPILMLFPQG